MGGHHSDHPGMVIHKVVTMMITRKIGKGLVTSRHISSHLVTLPIRISYDRSLCG